MAETHATTPPDTPVFPPGRYGRRREPRRHGRLAAALGLVAVLAVALTLAVVLYRRYGDPSYDPQLLGYGEITDTGVAITFRVTVPEGGSALCAVRARARDGSVVGSAEVPVSAGQGRVTYRLATSARPVTGEVVRCRPAP